MRVPNTEKETKKRKKRKKVRTKWQLSPAILIFLPNNPFKFHPPHSPHFKLFFFPQAKSCLFLSLTFSLFSPSSSYSCQPLLLLPQMYKPSMHNQSTTTPSSHPDPSPPPRNSRVRQTSWTCGTTWAQFSPPPSTFTSSGTASGP